MDDLERTHKRELLTIHRRHRQALEVQAATMGVRTPAEVRLQIQDCQRQIDQLERELGPGTEESEMTVTAIDIRPAAVRETVNDHELRLRQQAAELAELRTAVAVLTTTLSAEVRRLSDRITYLLVAIGLVVLVALGFALLK